MTQDSEDLGFELPAPASGSRARILIVVVVIVGAAFGVGYLQHTRAHGDTPAIHADATPRVEAFKPSALASDRALSLPGAVRPLEQAQIFPQTSGYVRKWSVDIGDKVTAGQLLVEIDTPEVDAQLAQARAQLLQARAAVKQATAQRDFTKSNSARFDTLADQKLISQSQVEQTHAQAATDEASVAAAESNVAAQEANVRRLQQLQDFARVVAPFAGTVTTRSVDRGALVGAGGTTPMFTIVATDPVRVFVEVPQTVAPSVKVGIDAKVTVREYAGRAFPGKVTRVSGALDPELHTMTIEIQVPNADGALLPGMYVQASLTLAVPHHVFEIPSTALYSDSLGVRVAAIDAQHKIHFVPITIERDTGATLWVSTGLTGDEQLVKIAVPSLVDGDVVEVAK
jgi:RND family efflux transporter MFP subunit